MWHETKCTILSALHKAVWLPCYSYDVDQSELSGNQLKQVKYIGKLSVNTNDKTIDLCLRDAQILIWAFIIFLLAGDGMVFNYLYSRRVVIPFIDCEIPNGFVNSVN